MKGVDEDDTGGVARHEDFELIEANWVVDVFVGDVEEEVVILGEPGLGVAGGDNFFGGVVVADVTDGALGELDAGEGDAIDEADDIVAPCLVAAGALALELRGDVEGVVAGGLPVDAAQVESLGLALDCLVEAFAQREQVIDLLAGAHEAFEGHIP